MRRRIALPVTLYDIFPYDQTAYLTRIGVAPQVALEIVLANWMYFAVNDRESYYSRIAEWLYESVVPSAACEMPGQLIREQMDDVVDIFLAAYQRLLVYLGQIPLEVLEESSYRDQMTFDRCTPSGQIILNL